MGSISFCTFSVSFGHVPTILAKNEDKINFFRIKPKGMSVKKVHICGSAHFEPPCKRSERCLTDRAGISNKLKIILFYINDEEGSSGWSRNHITLQQQ
jgi:hypothetical protein